MQHENLKQIIKFSEEDILYFLKMEASNIIFTHLQAKEVPARTNNMAR